MNKSLQKRLGILSTLLLLSLLYYVPSMSQPGNLPCLLTIGETNWVPAGLVTDGIVQNDDVVTIGGLINSNDAIGRQQGLYAASGTRAICGFSYVKIIPVNIIQPPTG